MRILALLPDDARRVLEHTLGPASGVSRETNPRAAALAVRERKCDAVVLDPTVLDEKDFEHVLAAISHSAVPVMLFTPLNALSARRIVRVAEMGAHELVLRGVEEQTQLVLLRTLASLLDSSVTAMLLNRVAPRFRRFPGRLQTASVGLFGGGPMPRWVDEFAVASGFGRRTVDRWMHRTGINGAAMLLDVVRLARVWEPLVESRLPIGEIATRFGYKRSRLLVSHARRIVHAPPPDLGTKITRVRFAERLAAALLEH